MMIDSAGATDATGGNEPLISWFQIEWRSISTDIYRVVFDSTALSIATGTTEWRRGGSQSNATAHSDSSLHSHSSLSNGSHPLVNRSWIARWRIRSLARNAHGSLVRTVINSGVKVECVTCTRNLRWPRRLSDSDDSDKNTSVNTPLRVEHFLCSPSESRKEKQPSSIVLECLDLRK